ncbi:hypothetical protein [Noviherbaspirillum sp.]|uniref:hypothetical protein n=1 Tax=Noviherbaspirillum sp. TaxID=1926288 RepID=UPI002D68B4E4|nr:hypothetical protein [Noviherbaspirillum sp.]HZW23171.1 hypothetical protein [Noviherbaspirillum sp.]
MPIPRTTAKRLLSETEFRLINDSFPPQIGTLSDKGLLQRVERTRKARDRYHELVERQQNKSASGAPAGLKEVISKEKIFEETLARFERQSSKAGSAGMKAAANTPARSMEGKKASGTKSGSQGVSKASVKTANKAAAGKTAASKATTKSAAKPAPKAGKGKGAVTKATPRGRHGAHTPDTTLH